MEKFEKKTRDQDLNEYLWFGYNIPEVPPQFLLERYFRGIQEVSYSNGRAKTAHDIFAQIISDTVARDRSRCLVPMSGGWDSRLILAELRRQIPPERICAVSFGVPGSLDLEIGCGYSESLGIEVERLDLSMEEMTWDRLEEAAFYSSGALPTLAWPNLTLLRKAAERKEALYSGFIGDFINGGHDKALAAAPSSYFLSDFASRKKFSSGVCLTQSDYFPQTNDLNDDGVSYFVSAKHAMYLWYRVLGSTAPTILGQSMTAFVSYYQNPYNKDCAIFTPYTDKRWIKFWANADQRERCDQSLFFEMVKEFYPAAWAFPSKSSWGARQGSHASKNVKRALHKSRNYLHRVAPWFRVRSTIMDNYIDFQWAFRERDDYIAVLEKAFDILKQSEAVPWLDLDKIWREHYRARQDHGNALQVLLGLAVKLEVCG